MSVNNKGYQGLSVTAAVVGLTIPDGAKGAFIVVQTAAVCYRDDGTAPVAAAGSSTVLNVGDTLTFDSWTPPGNDWRTVLKTIQFKENTATDAKLSIHYYD